MASVRFDGTMVAAGDNDEGQHNVGGWCLGLGISLVGLGVREIIVCAEFLEGSGQKQNSEQGMCSDKKRKIDG